MQGHKKASTHIVCVNILKLIIWVLVFYFWNIILFKLHHTRRTAKQKTKLQRTP